MKHAEKKKKSDEMKSVCEKSMELVVNIIKISSFSMAAMNLGKGETKSSLSRSKTSSQTPLTKSSVDDENFSDYIKRFHTRNKNEAQAVTDGKAAAFIRRFHEKNSRDFTLAAPPLLPLPPPPRLSKIADALSGRVYEMR